MSLEHSIANTEIEDVMELAFYNVGCERAGRKRDLIILPRRAFRRLMRPMLFRLRDILSGLVQRHDRSDQNILTIHAEFLALRTEVLNLRGHLPAFQQQIDVLRSEVGTLRAEVVTLTHWHHAVSDQARTAIAMAWDEAAVVRRLAIIEEHVESLLPANVRAAAQDEAIPAIMFPGLVKAKSQIG